MQVLASFDVAHDERRDQQILKYIIVAAKVSGPFDELLTDFILERFSGL
jgi:hypothetical protein